MLFLRLLSRLPLTILYLFSDFLFFIGFYLVRYRRPLVKRNLVHSFPDKGKKELRAIEQSFYRNLCDYAVDMLKLVTMSRE